MLKKIIGVVLALIVLVLGYAATRPDTFRVERAATIQAPPDKVFPLINDFNRWPEWSPWEKLDPAMKRTLSSPASGKGASYAWEGNKQVGTGSMEILESVPSSKVVINLTFLKPFEQHSTSEFTLAGKDGATDVTWVMQGPQPYMAKVMCLFMNMDKMVGGDFEKGLAAMKAVAEKPAAGKGG